MESAALQSKIGICNVDTGLTVISSLERGVWHPGILPRHRAGSSGHPVVAAATAAAATTAAAASQPGSSQVAGESGILLGHPGILPRHPARQQRQPGQQPACRPGSSQPASQRQLSAVNSLVTLKPRQDHTEEPQAKRRNPQKKYG